GVTGLWILGYVGSGQGCGRLTTKTFQPAPVAYIETANPKDDVFGNVGRVVGDALQMTRGQDKLQPRADQLRLAGHALKLAFENAVAVPIHDVIAFQDRGGHIHVAENERAEALADHGANGRNHGDKIFGDLRVGHFPERDDSLGEVYGEVADALQIVV